MIPLRLTSKASPFYYFFQDMQNEKGEEYEYKDRRQEIVFIGHGMKRDVIQDILDQCLLTDEEMALGKVVNGNHI